MQETLDKDIQTSFQSIKVQIVVADNQLQSKEGVRRIIKKYQGRIADMLKLIQKQKRQNDTLKEQFKQLNQQLNTVLKKMQQRPKQQEQKNIDSRLEVIKKQLENEIKKNAILKKQIEQLRYKCKYLDSDKIDSFKNQIKEKQRAIDDLNAQIKLFEKLDKQEKNGDSYKKQEELTQKILQLNQEIVHLKKKMQQSKKKEEELQKTIKNLRLQIIQAESKANISKPSQQKEKSKVQKQLEEQNQKLKQKYKQLQNAKKMKDKNSRQEIQSLSFKIKSLQRQLSETKQAINRKDKQSNILLFKLKQKERKTFNTLQPIKTNRYSQHILHSTGNLFQVRKQSKGLSWGQGIFSQFDDIPKLPIEKNYRIKKVSFTYFQEHILSLATIYEIVEADTSKTPKKQTKFIQTFAIPANYANTKSVEYNFGDYEYIKVMDVYCNKDNNLEIVSFRNWKPKKHSQMQITKFLNWEFLKAYSFLWYIVEQKVGRIKQIDFSKYRYRVEKKIGIYKGKKQKIIVITQSFSGRGKSRQKQ